MQGAPAIPLDVMAYASLATLVLGLLAMVPVWWSNHRGWYLTPTPEEMRVRTLAFTLTVGGMAGLLGTGIAAMQRSLSAGMFIGACCIGCAVLLIFAFTVDARARRRH